MRPARHDHVGHRVPEVLRMTRRELRIFYGGLAFVALYLVAFVFLPGHP